MAEFVQRKRRRPTERKERTRRETQAEGRIETALLHRSFWQKHAFQPLGVPGESSASTHSSFTPGLQSAPN